MSETVHYKGKAVEICNGKEYVEIEAKILCAKKGILEIKSYYNSWAEQLCDKFYKEYFYHIISETLYDIEWKEIEIDEDIVRAERQSNGTIEFELRYYNGGAGFTECLEEAMDKL